MLTATLCSFITRLVRAGVDDDLFCCILTPCTLSVNGIQRSGHCRPINTCPGITDDVSGTTVGCDDNGVIAVDIVAYPLSCCVQELVNVTCPLHYDRYINAISKSYSLQNATYVVASRQRLVAWAPFLGHVFENVVGTCIYDCHQVSMVQFFMDVLSELFVFQSGSTGFYTLFLDAQGVKKGLLPPGYFSYYSPSVFANVVTYIFQNYNLIEKFGSRSFLSANRIFDLLNQELAVPLASYTTIFKVRHWRVYKQTARFLGCAPAMMDGSECSNGQGLCFINRIPKLFNASEYVIHCPAYLTLQSGDCPGYPSNVVCCAKPLTPIQLGASLNKNEFYDIVVALHPLTYLDPQVFTDIQSVFTSASGWLYQATGGRAYFRTVSILSAFQYFSQNVTNATFETYRDAEFKFTDDYLSPPRVVQRGSCGESGLGVYMHQGHLRQWGSAQTVAKLFAMNRWGIGDEYPSTLAETKYVPDFQVNEAATLLAASSCTRKVEVDYMPTLVNSQLFNMTVLNYNPHSSASFGFRPDIFNSTNAEFCFSTTTPHCDTHRRHNALPDTPHNRICNRVGTMDVILHTPDFELTQNTPRYVGNTAPTFRIVQYPLIIDNLIVVIADLSGSIQPNVLAMMINAIIDFLLVTPDEVPVALLYVAPGAEVLTPDPITPYTVYEVAGYFGFAGRVWGRPRLIEHARSFVGLFDRLNRGYANTSVLTGISTALNYYTKAFPNSRLKMLVFSDFMSPFPADNSLLAKIRLTGTKIWPVSVIPKAKMTAIQQQYNMVDFPLYDYAQLLANATQGRWQLIANTSSMAHWMYAFGTFLDDNSFGTPILIQTLYASPGDTISIPFYVPKNQNLNTTLIVDYDINLVLAAVVSGPASINITQLCYNEDRGFQSSMRLACLTKKLSGPVNFTVKFGNLSGLSGLKFEVNVLVMTRALEYGAYLTGFIYPGNSWLPPNRWLNRASASTLDLPKTEATITPRTYFVLEKSKRFRFPKAYAIAYIGPNAVLNCSAQFDLWRDGTLIESNSPMFDDGNGEDGFASDGVYTAILLNANVNGSYSLYIRIHQTPDGSAPSSYYRNDSTSFVGRANNLGAAVLGDTIELPLFLYKTIAFDVIVPSPNGVGDIVPPGRIQVVSALVDQVVPPSFIQHWPATHLYGLPGSVRIVMNILAVGSDMRNATGNVTYMMAVSTQIADFTNYYEPYNIPNASNVSVVIKADGATPYVDTIGLWFYLTPPRARYYYCLAWAVDTAGNIAPRSAIKVLEIPLFSPTTVSIGLPLVTDVTTPLNPDNRTPWVIIVSVIFGLILAFAIITTAVCVKFRQRKRQPTNDRVCYPSTAATQLYDQRPLPQSWETKAAQFLNPTHQQTWGVAHQPPPQTGGFGYYGPQHQPPPQLGGFGYYGPQHQPPPQLGGFGYYGPQQQQPPMYYDAAPVQRTFPPPVIRVPMSNQQRLSTSGQRTAIRQNQDNVQRSSGGGFPYGTTPASISRL